MRYTLFISIILRKIRYLANYWNSIAHWGTLWGILILGILSINYLPFLNKNDFSSAFLNKNLGGPIIQDSLLAVAAANTNIINDETENVANSDAISQTYTPNSDPKNKTKNTEYFTPPTIGWNWGKLHDYNAIDIANRCGTPIYASAEGFIVSENSNGDWNDGYGNSIIIEHPNNTQTLYAHLKKSIVSIGQHIKSKELIGYMGNTGNTDGPTGCHLHFEVHGAKNPLAKE